MKVMLSWSGARSKEIASALRDWLPNIIQSIVPWMSDSDIDVGMRWGPNLDKELEDTHFGILCLTPECLESPWIHYEAGALSKVVDKSHVCPYLFGFEPSDMKGPLVNFHAAQANKDGTFKLLQSINNTIDNPLHDERIKTIFERFWSDLEREFERVSNIAQESPKSTRSDKDVLNEILELSRIQSTVVSEILDKIVEIQEAGLGDPLLERLDKNLQIHKLGSGYWLTVKPEDSSEKI